MFGLLFYVAGISCAIIIYGAGLYLFYLVLIKPFRSYDKRQQERKDQIEKKRLWDDEMARQVAEDRKDPNRLKRLYEEHETYLRSLSPEDRQEHDRLVREDELTMERNRIQAEIDRERYSKELQYERDNPKPVLSWSEWIWQNPHVRQSYYNKIGRVLDKLDKM